MFEGQFEVDLNARVTPSLVVAIGAAQGGIEALQAFFIALDDSAGMSFVVSQRALPGSERLPQLLRQVSELPVTLIRHGATLEPDHIFVAPAGYCVELRSTTFVLSRPSEPGVRRKPFDTLFCSIASMFGERGVGIVLSGVGDDGCLGLQMIARAQGLTLAQDPTRAAFAAMPDTAIASGAVAQVLSPFAMADVLLAHAARRNEPADTDGYAHELARAVHALRLEKAELTRFNQELLSIHGKLHATIAQIRGALGELRAQHDALSAVHANLSSLLGDATLAVVQLDANLRVTAFTPNATRIYEARSLRVGVALEAVAHQAHEMPPLPALSELQHGQAGAEVDVVTRDRWYLRRTLPRMAHGTAIDGMFVAFVDVTQLKTSEAAASPHERWLRSITDSMPAIISLVDDAVHCY